MPVRLSPCPARWLCELVVVVWGCALCCGNGCGAVQMHLQLAAPMHPFWRGKGGCCTSTLHPPASCPPAVLAHQAATSSCTCLRSFECVWCVYPKARLARTQGTSLGADHAWHGDAARSLQLARLAKPPAVHCIGMCLVLIHSTVCGAGRVRQAGEDVCAVVCWSHVCGLAPKEMWQRSWSPYGMHTRALVVVFACVRCPLWRVTAAPLLLVMWSRSCSAASSRLLWTGGCQRLHQLQCAAWTVPHACTRQVCF